MNESKNRIKTNIQRVAVSFYPPPIVATNASVWQQVVSKRQNQSIYKTILMFIFSFFFLFICLRAHLVTNRWQQICSPPFQFIYLFFSFWCVLCWEREKCSWFVDFLHFDPEIWMLMMIMVWLPVTVFVFVPFRIRMKGIHLLFICWCSRSFWSIFFCLVFVRKLAKGFTSSLSISVLLVSHEIVSNFINAH